MMQHQYTTGEIHNAPQNSPRVTRGIVMPSSMTKTVIVLGWLLAWRPTVALALGQLVLRVWPSSGGCDDEHS